MQNSEVLIPITMFLCAFGILYVFFTTRHKERLSLIEKGADPTLFESKKVNGNTAMKFGMLFIGVALGILMGNILAATTMLEEPVAYLSMIFLFGGLSLVTYYVFIEKKNQN